MASAASGENQVPLGTDNGEAINSVDAEISVPSQLAYWQSISPDVSGMLGGYPQVSRIDVQFSRNFLHKLRRMYKKSPESNLSTSSSVSKPSSGATTSKRYSFNHVLEPGAGIGRVTLNLLAPLCAKIDIIEPIQKFTDVITAPESPLVQGDQLCRVWNLPLQEWTAHSKPAYTSPSAESLDLKYELKYDLIYHQWCLNHLTLPSLVAHFKSLIPLLSPDGWIIVKENLSTDPFGEDIFDEVDSSVTRSDANWRTAYQEAGLKVVRTELQTGFAKDMGLYPVRMYALRPA